MAEATVMEPAKIRRFLVKSKTEPVSVAIGIADDGPRMLLDPLKQPSALGNLLRRDNPTIKNLRWGMAEVDVDVNPKLVTITVNKACPPIAKKLKPLLKGTGFSKIVLKTEDGETLESLDDEAGDDAPAAPGAPEPPPAFDAAKLNERLRALIEQVRAAVANVPAQKDGLLALVTAAGTALKAGELEGAHARMDELTEALATATAPAGTGDVAFAKMRLLWEGTRKTLAEQVKTLEAAITEATDGDPNAEAIAAEYGVLHAPVGALDNRLTDALDRLTNAGGTDPALKKAARDIAVNYQTYLSNNKLMQEFDANPFVPLDARRRIDGALAAIVSRL